MAKADKTRSDNRKPGKKAKADTAKPSSRKAQAKEGKNKEKGKLQEQVLALGGDNEDLALLKGVDGDRDLVQGEQAADVRNAFRTGWLSYSNPQYALVFPISLSSQMMSPSSLRA